MDEPQSDSVERVFKRFRDPPDFSAGVEAVEDLGHQLIDDTTAFWRLCQHIAWLHENGIEDIPFVRSETARLPPELAAQLDAYSAPSEALIQFASSVFLECCESVSDFWIAIESISLIVTGDNAGDVNVWLSGVGGRCFAESLGLLGARVATTVIDALWQYSPRSECASGWSGTVRHPMTPSGMVPACVAVINVFPEWELPETMHLLWNQEVGSFEPFDSDVNTSEASVAEANADQSAENENRFLPPLNSENKSTLESAWPPDGEWYFHNAVAAFKYVVFEATGKPGIVLKRLSEAAANRPNVTWRELAAACEAAGGSEVDQETIRGYVRDARDILRRTFNCGDSDPIPNTERGTNCSWKINNATIKAKKTKRKP